MAMVDAGIHPMFEQRSADASTRVRAGVAVAIRDADGRILLELRRDCSLWGLPGGRIEAGESAREAAVREVAEETGLAVEVQRLIGVYSDPAQRVVAYVPGESVQLVDILFAATIVGGRLTISPESELLQFFDPDHLPPNIVPPAIAPLRDALAGITGAIA
jgi:ADP-ribose pyrophosphatase YjhB (NUDIX family)